MLNKIRTVPGTTSRNASPSAIIATLNGSTIVNLKSSDGSTWFMSPKAELARRRRITRPEVLTARDLISIDLMCEAVDHLTLVGRKCYGAD